ncbi:NADPH-dependent ferric siderophore reductase [Murinocardiopsis flavida]|uniref:NADPH-dependent ferric siderophore reductase n=1 Tax=Murinocardiopsis flavida TaxID=645275 RepID=A0A2P8DL89_9ACTN|nr:siderophore-interacting protein [Murinocardiopsis flavida]PSK97986.1 NADPH-dependent ferric siderophore reductase [Murinocardiopsis flavida]
MSDRSKRDKRRVHRGVVRHVEWVSPHMIRVVLGGDGLAELTAGDYTDHYVKLLFPQPGTAHPDPFDMEAIRRDRPKSEWPTTRTYTVRSWDPEQRELAIDFVHHGDRGLAGPWAAAARAGDEIAFFGPGGGYAPDPAADWHLLAGDESALPAIAASVERLPAGARAHVFVEVADAAEEQKLAVPGGAEVHWVHRGGREVGAALVEAVRGLDFPGGTMHAFVHGEAGFVKELRRLLRKDLGYSKDALSISGYWRRGRDEDGWQSSKAEWNRAIEDEEAAAGV